MGLSEFTSKNNKDIPDRQEEWKQGKLLIATIIESGAVLLLEQLRDSILHNPKLDDNVQLRKLLFVHNHPRLSSENQFLQDLYLSKFSCVLPTSLVKIPRAEVELRYNARINRPPSYYTPFGVSTVGKGYFKYDTLTVMCQDSKILNLSVHYYSNKYRQEGSRSENSILEESQWKNKNTVDDALGKLYSLSPVRLRSEKI